MSDGKLTKEDLIEFASKNDILLNPRRDLDEFVKLHNCLGHCPHPTRDGTKKSCPCDELWEDFNRHEQCKEGIFISKKCAMKMTIESNYQKYYRYLNNLLDSEKHTFDKNNSTIPNKPGVYVIFNDRTDEILYVGTSGKLRRRLLSDHRRANYQKKKNSMFRIHLSRRLNTDDEEKISEFILNNCSFKYIELENKRKRLEGFAIAMMDPKLNPSER